MSNSGDLLSKLHFFEKFKDIASAIQMVAISGLNKLKLKIQTRQISLLIIKDFFIDFNIFEKILSGSDKKSWLLIPMTSDKQFCGIINKKILKSTIKELNIIKNKSNSIPNVYIIGDKGLRAFKRMDDNTTLLGICDGIHLSNINLFSIYDLFLKLFFFYYDVLILLFNKFFSAFDQRVAKYELPCLSIFISALLIYRDFNYLFSSLLEKNKGNDFYYIDIYYYSISLILIDSFEENEYSELGSRAVSMESTIQNTKNKISEYRIRYNRTRQTQITTELVEIISAAESMNN